MKKKNNKVEAFKNELRNYNFYLLQKKEITERINDEYYRLSGVTSINPSKSSNGSASEEYQNLKKLEIMEKIDELKIKKYFYDVKIYSIEKTLKKLEKNKKEIVIKIYAEKIPYKKIGEQYRINKSSLYYVIDEWLDDIID